jgi:hypothetical protein
MVEQINRKDAMENDIIEVHPKRGIISLGLIVIFGLGCFLIYGGWKGLDPNYFITGKYHGLFNGTPWWLRGSLLIGLGIYFFSLSPRVAARAFSNGPSAIFNEKEINFQDFLSWKKAEWSDIEKISANRFQTHYSSYAYMTIHFKKEYGKTVLGRNIKIVLPANGSEFNSEALVKMIGICRPDISGDLERQFQLADFNRKSFLNRSTKN